MFIDEILEKTIAETERFRDTITGVTSMVVASAGTGTTALLCQLAAKFLEKTESKIVFVNTEFNPGAVAQQIMSTFILLAKSSGKDAQTAFERLSLYSDTSPTAEKIMSLLATTKEVVVLVDDAALIPENGWRDLVMDPSLSDQRITLCGAMRASRMASVAPSMVGSIPELRYVGKAYKLERETLSNSLTATCIKDRVTSSSKPPYVIPILAWEPEAKKLRETLLAFPTVTIEESIEANVVREKMRKRKRL